MEILQQVMALKAELDGHRPLDKDQEAAIMQKFRLDWNFHSNHLEGNSLTYGETKALILFGITASGKPLKDHFEITGHDEAVKWVEDVVKEDRPLSESFIRELHKLILKEPYEVAGQTEDGKPQPKKVKIGEYKTTPNHVLTATGEIFRFATPEETPARMTDLIDWYRKKKDDADTHPLLLAAEFHYRFIRIHPFDDGNGRTVRILMNFILMQNGYPPVVVKTEDKENYFAALRQADAGNITPFIEYIGKNLEQSLELMIRGAKGETIDEVDDVDKEIMLIKQRIKNISKDVFTLKSADSIQEVFENTLKRLLSYFITNCKKFDEFYSTSGYNYQVNGNGDGKSYSGEIDFGQMENLIKISKNQTNNIRLTYNYKKFKEYGLPYFNYSSALEIRFEKNDYSIYSLQGDLLYSKPYHKSLSDEDILGIVTIETKAHTNFINQQIEKAKETK